MEPNNTSSYTPPVGRILLALIAIALLFVISMGAFIVQEGEQAVITRFGKPIRVIAGASDEREQASILEQVNAYSDATSTRVKVGFGAGLYFKIPIADDAEMYESRLLQYDSPPEQVITGDKKRLVIDTFARWRISNPLLFRQTCKTEVGAQARLDDVIYSVVRGELANYNFDELIRTTNNIYEVERVEPLPDLVTRIQVGRTKIMEQVTALCDKSARDFGVRIMDVRVKRADLPEENRRRVYERMSEERKRIATRWTEQGRSEAKKLTSETDKDVQIMKAEAYRKSQIIKGEGDADALKIYAQGFTAEDDNGVQRRVLGFQSDPEFYQFLRKLEALEKVSDVSTTYVLSTDSELFGILKIADPSSAGSQ